MPTELRRMAGRVAPNGRSSCAGWPGRVSRGCKTLCVNRVEETINALRGQFGAAARVAHQPNHAGADKLSFVIDLPNRARSYWLKIARDENDDRALRRWVTSSQRLTDRYRAPQSLGAFVLQGRTALVFELIEGRVASATSDPEIARRKRDRHLEALARYRSRF